MYLGSTGSAWGVSTSTVVVWGLYSLPPRIICNVIVSRGRRHALPINLLPTEKHETQDHEW